MQSLPTELLQRIGYEVERLADRKCLRHTCSRLGSALKPLLLAEVTLNIHTENLEPGLGLLHALVEQSNSEYSEHIRQISIVSLSPDFYPSPRVAYRRLPPTTGMTGWDSNDPLCAWITDERSTQNKKIRKAQSDIRRLLEPALKSLYNLRVVQWYWRITDPEWISDTIAKSLSTLQHIEEFIYQYTVPHYLWPRFPTLPPIILPELRNLKVVSVSILTRQISRHRAGNGVIQSLIDHSPSEGDGLERGMSIRFDSGSWKIPDALEAFLPSAISHLGLYSWILDEAFYTNLTDLTSLELCDVIPVEFGATRIWSILSSNQIRLQRLIVDYISTGMLDYLESYSGLEHLSLKCTTGHVQTNRDADRFYNQTLVLHEDTLLSLTIQPKFEGKWCFSEGNVGSFRRCRKLQSLSVRVNSEEISVDPISETEGVLFPKPDRLYANPVHLLLQMTASFLDHLQILHINPAVAVGRTGCLRPNSEACSEQCCCYFGKEYFDAAKRRIQASIQIDSNGDSYDRTVLTWVKIYVGGERVVEKREDEIVKRKSKWPVLRSARRLFLTSTSSRLRKK